MISYQKRKNAAKIQSDYVEQFPANLLLSKNITPNVISFAGFAENEKTGSNLFYWFFESEQCLGDQDPQEMPLVIWLNGGPGGSSLLGMFMENGPYLMQYNDSATIVENPNAWNQSAHILYWDQPVGTGYSYNSNNEYVTSEEELRKQFYDALQIFYQKHPEYRKCPLYIAGESYAGKYIPHIATEIDIQNKKASQELHINLKGLAIGDGWMEPAIQVGFQIDYAFAMGFLDTHQKDLLLEANKKLIAYIKEEDWKNGVPLNNKIDEVLLRCCGNPNIYDVRGWGDHPSITLCRDYFNTDSVKSALNVHSQRTWQCADNSGPVSQNLESDILKNVTPLFPHLLKAESNQEDTKSAAYRLLFYIGNFDMSCGYQGTEFMLNHISWAHKETWLTAPRKVWAYPGNKTRGYVKEVANLTQATIPDAGHMVPLTRPTIMRELLYNFIFRHPFPGYYPLTDKI